MPLRMPLREVLGQGFGFRVGFLKLGFQGFGSRSWGLGLGDSGFLPDFNDLVTLKPKP